jgi:hypothetical protein
MESIQVDVMSRKGFL